MARFTNIKIEYDGYKFDSLKERDFYLYLLERYPRDTIQVHPRFKLIDSFVANGDQTVRGITYIGDFQVGNVVYDVKNSGSYTTPEFKLKWKFVKYFFRSLLFTIVYRKGKEWIMI